MGTEPHIVDRLRARGYTVTWDGDLNTCRELAIGDAGAVTQLSPEEAERLDTTKKEGAK